MNIHNIHGNRGIVLTGNEPEFTPEAGEAAVSGSRDNGDAITTSLLALDSWKKERETEELGERKLNFIKH